MSKGGFNTCASFVVTLLFGLYYSSDNFFIWLFDFLIVDDIAIAVEEITFVTFQRHDANRKGHDTVHEKVSAIV